MNSFKEQTKKITHEINTNPNFLTLLGVIFVVLKVFGITMVADWSWWVVLLPFYAGLAFLLGILGVFGCVALLCGAGLLLIEGFDSLKNLLTKSNKK